MIRPSHPTGVVFGEAADGDPRRDADARFRLSAALGITSDWAWLRQVHGATTVLDSSVYPDFVAIML